LKVKKNGSIAIILLFSWLLFIILLLGAFTFERYLANEKAEMVENDIVFSNLATYKNIDLKALGDTPYSFKFTDPNLALDTFYSYLKTNMKLDNNLQGLSNSVATGTVTVKTYIIYEISGSTCNIYTYNSATKTFNNTTVSDITVTPVTSPSGVNITKTSVYTVLSYNIVPVMPGILGHALPVKTSVLTDITY